MGWGLGALGIEAQGVAGGFVHATYAGTAASGVGSGTNYILSTDEFKWGEFGASTLQGGISGLFGSAMGFGASWGFNALFGLTGATGWFASGASGAAGGGLSGIAEQILLNKAMGCKWDTNLLQAGVTGSGGGLLGGLFQHWGRLQQARQADEAPRRPGLPQRTSEGAWRKGQLTNREFKGLRRFAKRWNQRIVLSGSLSETDIGLQRRYDESLQEYLPLFRKRKPRSGLIDTGIGDVDLWEGSELRRAQLAEISELFGGWETDMGYELKYYDTLESFAEQAGALVFEPSGKVWRVPAPWQLPEWP